MPGIARLTVTLPAEMADLLNDALESGAYASASDLVAEALRDWHVRSTPGRLRLGALRDDIDAGLADVAAGRVVEADLDDIMARGRQLSAGRDNSG